MDRVDQGLTAMRQAFDRQDWLEVISQAGQALFFQKMAHQLWIMNWNAQPQPRNLGEIARDNVNYAEYFQARDILASIQSELSNYLTLERKPAEDTVQGIRDNLDQVLESLDILLRDGINAGLTDREYLRMLMTLRSIAMFVEISSVFSALFGIKYSNSKSKTKQFNPNGFTVDAVNQWYLNE